VETNAESTAPVEAPKVDTEVADTPSEGTAPSGTEAPASGDDTSSWTEKAQKRYDELTRERYEAAARADRAEYRLQEAERRIAEREATAKTEQVAPVPDFPTLEQFGWDEAKYQAAISAHWKETAKAEARAVIEQEKAEQQRNERANTWAKREAEILKSKPEYAEKVKNAAYLPISRELQQQLQGIELGPQIALHLVENPEKARAIMQMPIEAQLREVGRIEGALEAAKASTPPPVSKAPPPTSKLDASEEAAPVRVDSAESDKLSDTEWTRRRNAQEKAALRRRNG
jgi:hypothetical protein